MEIKSAKEALLTEIKSINEAGGERGNIAKDHFSDDLLDSLGVFEGEYDEGYNSITRCEEVIDFRGLSKMLSKTVIKTGTPVMVVRDKSAENPDNFSVTTASGDFLGSMSERFCNTFAQLYDENLLKISNCSVCYITPGTAKSKAGKGKTLLIEVILYFSSAEPVKEIKSGRKKTNTRVPLKIPADEKHPEMTVMLDVPEQFKNLFKSGPTEMKSGEPIVLTYNEGKRVHCPQFSIGVPDGYEYEENATRDIDGFRDFFIGISDENSEFYNDGIYDDRFTYGRLRLLSGDLNEYSHNGDSAELLIDTSNMYALEASLCGVQAEMEKKLGSALMAITEIDTGDVKALCRISLNMMSVKNCYIYIVCPDGYKLIRIDALRGDVSNENLIDIAKGWVSTIEMNEKFTERTALDDSGFFKKALTKKAVNDWADYAKRWLLQYIIRSKLGVKAKLAKFIHIDSNDTVNKNVKKPIIDTATDLNNMFSEISRLAPIIAENNSDKEKLDYFYGKVGEVIDSIVQSAENFDAEIKSAYNTLNRATGHSFKVPAKLSDSLKTESAKKALDSCFSKISGKAEKKKAPHEIPDKGKTEAKVIEKATDADEAAAAVKRAENKKAKEELKLRQIEENKCIISEYIDSLGDYKDKVTAELKGYTDKLNSERAEKIRSLEAEKKLHEEALAGLKFYNIVQKAREKEEISRIAAELSIAKDSSGTEAKIKKAEQEAEKLISEYEFEVKDYLTKMYYLDYTDIYIKENFAKTLNVNIDENKINELYALHEMSAFKKERTNAELTDIFRRILKDDKVTAQYVSARAKHMKMSGYIIKHDTGYLITAEGKAVAKDFAREIKNQYLERKHGALNPPSQPQSIKINI